MERRPLTGAILAGILAGLGQAPISLPFATLLGLAVCFVLHLRSPGVRSAAWVGFCFGLGYFALTLHWIVEPFFVDPLRHGWMAPFALILMAAGMGLFWGLAGGAAHWLTKGTRGRLGAALAWGALLAMAELARSYVMTGFPWALLGHVWVGWAPMQLAAFIGPHGLSLLTVLAAAALGAAWPHRQALVKALSGGGLVYGACLWLAMLPAPPPTQHLVRLIQPNAPQHLKWHPDHARSFFDRQVAFTGADTDPRPDLIIWPETAIPTRLEYADFALDLVRQAAAGVPVILGIQRVESARAYNSLVLLDAQGALTQVYDKHHLVPFGEYIPAGNLMAKVGITAFASQLGNGYSAGPGPQMLDLGSMGRALPLICYEAIFPQDVNAAPERPDWLLQITNDAWFGKWVGPYQHLAQARLRAVEQGLPMVRVANTGVSAVVDSRGQVVVQLDLNQEGFLDAVLPGALPQTLYARTGDWPWFLLYFLTILTLWALRQRNQR